ncbi:MAG: Spx/MgsR family RNA polymerase-binding regulatory protein [Nitrosomonas sp.]|uniref:Spx/MgsR family RNA polymerase-binding regulatory protein n=1 Tax=Nitrosomonas sp. TaxID=42353 RepID=UPI0025D5B366|nr:Spx/MgsR family RNA polymerase-binding regulatory protein [Nitrosomonas sp.]MBY0475601.1 Spx/MgsR family RNA polymerase-binding regulatory protein [Nitrosomonas sp.]
MLKFYGYKQCGTCRKAEQFLQQAEIDYEFLDITENPPAVDELAAIVERANVSLNKLFNTSGVQYRELKIKEQLPALSSREILTILAGNGRLIKRPLITDGERASVGFDAEKFALIWG